MHVVRFTEAPEYTAPGHHEMAMVRLQGREAGPSSELWIGVSVIAPGGGTTLSSSPQEKMYVVLDGTLHLSNGESEVALGRWDSCRIARHRRGPPPDQPYDIAGHSSSGDAALGR